MSAVLPEVQSNHQGWNWHRFLRSQRLELDPLEFDFFFEKHVKDGFDVHKARIFDPFLILSLVFLGHSQQCILLWVWWTCPDIVLQMWTNKISAMVRMHKVTDLWKINDLVLLTALPQFRLGVNCRSWKCWDHELMVAREMRFCRPAMCAHWFELMRVVSRQARCVSW